VLNDDDDDRRDQRIIKHGSVRSSDDNNIGQYDVTPSTIVVDAVLLALLKEQCAV
jgi:hypothetical protein